MKKSLLIVLAVISMQSAFAQRVPHLPGERPGGPLPGGRMDLTMCLKTLDNAERRNDNLQNQVNEIMRTCNSNGNGNQREIEELRRDNQRLTFSVSDLQSRNDQLSYENMRIVNDNNDLRRQLDDLRNGGNRSLGFFSYAGCKDFAGNVDLKFIIGAEGRVNLESETSAKQKVAQSYSCTYGIAVVATEEIRSISTDNYCVAGCKDFAGNIDQKYIQSGIGRNVTEAQFNALKAVASKFTCTYGIKVQACQ